ncbi:MAG: hypothetical protein QF491_01200, partial [Alphaproteobacteria bacterium]|nr:hypothetical protein [Alphaproteobacteria bacterium]
MGARGIIAGLATRAHAAAFLRGAMGSLVAVVGAVAIWRSLGSSIGIGGILQFIVILGFVYAMVFALIATDDVDRVIGRGLVAAGTLALPLAAHSHLRLGLLAGRPGAAGQVLEVNFFLAAGLILAATLLPLGLWLLRPTTGPRLEDSPDFEAGRPRLRGFNLFYRRQLADWLTEKDTARREQDRQFHDITLWGVPGLAVIGAVTLHFGWLGPRAGWLFLLWVVALLIAGSAAAALRWSPTKQDRVAFLAELCGFFGLRHLTETGMAISHPNEPAMYSLRHFQELGLLAKDRKSELKDVFLGRYEDKPAALAEA